MPSGNPAFIISPDRTASSKYPTTPSFHIRPSGRIDNIFFRIDTIPVAAFFKSISAHVIYAEFVRFLRSYWMSLSFWETGAFMEIAFPAVVIPPCDFIHIIAAAVSVSLALVAASCCKFPFSFCRKSEGLTCEFIQASDEDLLPIVIT